jgi:predicted dehydrogenase
MAEARLRIGIAGAGFLARTRARCWRRVHGVRAELTAVASGSLPRAQAFAREHGIARPLADVRALCESLDVDVIDLCMPNAAHRTGVELAATAGKHVICTKPLAAYTGQDLPAGASEEAVAGRDRAAMLQAACADARAMQEACARAGVQLCYGENWLYAPSLDKAERLLRACGGRLLEIYGHEAHSGSHAPASREWRQAGGGALLRLGAHPLGAALWLLRRQGARPVAVTAEVRGAGPVESWGTAIVLCDDGARAVVHGSDHLHGGMESRLELRGEGFQFKCHLSPNDLLRAYATRDGAFGSEYLQEKLSTQAGWSTPMPDEDWTSGHQAMVQAFAEDLTAGRPPRGDGQLGADVVRVVYAAYLSAAQGRRVELSGLPG